ncbi:hypothetical protein RRG08_003603 [Elysia crispata]|uniref:Uncharacterized protein n=1 Tax=Elysia crispata TaxID=231223 RepID=A0AAE1ASQ1_9GAST|nr:hypothetical protein RRG08_003603 [Elysia crispata]
MNCLHIVSKAIYIISGVVKTLKMTEEGFGIILDLATDKTFSTLSKVVHATEKYLPGLVSKRRCENRDKYKDDVTVVVVLTTAKEPHLAAIDLPGYSTIISSDDYVDLLFKAKTYLDESPGFGCEVQVITSALMKKFWEAACLHMFSPVTTWSVRGVAVEDQPLTVKEPVAVARVENSIREYLKTVGDPGLVNIWRSDVIPGDQFNAGRSS